MVRLDYIIKAALLLSKLELKLRTKRDLSKKMGIMVDIEQVPSLPSRRLPIRVNGTSLDLVAHKGVRVFVYRNEDQPRGPISGVDIYESGNEIENPAVIEHPYTPEEYVLRQRQWPGPFPVSNPGLVSIQQGPNYWRALLKLGIEDVVDYLAIHFYIQSRKLDRIDNTWIEKKWYRKLSDKWEYIKAISALMEFRDRTTKPIIVTECGVCQLTAEIPEDVYFMDLILSEVLGNRLHMAAWYNYAELTEYPGHAMLAFY